MTLDAICEVLRARGVPDEEIRSAAEQGRLSVLLMTVAAVPEERRYTAAEVSERVGMERVQADRFWRALGFPDAGDTRMFTEGDVEALAVVKGMIDLGFTDVELALQMTRVIGSSMARIAESQMQLQSARMPDAIVAELGETVAAGYLETQSRLLDYVWRRHLEAAGRRAVLGGMSGEHRLAIGFADLVGFTALSQQLPPDDLARVVGRFEEVAYEQVVSHGGRIAKMIGDEVMFVVDDARAATETAIALADAYATDDMLSDVRVGLAVGPVLAREADYYGPVVNLASRIVGIAYPGSVVVSDEVHQALGDDPAFGWRRIRPRYLKDIGRVQLWHVRHAGAETESVRAAERRRRGRAGRLLPDLQRFAEAGREFVGADDETTG